MVLVVAEPTSPTNEDEGVWVMVVVNGMKTVVVTGTHAAEALVVNSKYSTKLYIAPKTTKRAMIKLMRDRVLEGWPP